MQFITAIADISFGPHSDCSEVPHDVIQTSQANSGLVPLPGTRCRFLCTSISNSLFTYQSTLRSCRTYCTGFEDQFADLRQLNTVTKV